MSGMFQYQLEHKDSRTARVLATSLDQACKAVEWFNADTIVRSMQPVEAFVIEKQPTRSEQLQRDMVREFRSNK